MTTQSAITIAAATIGFIAALFFCIGAVFNNPEQISCQATTYWNFNEPLAHSLAAQQAQYAVGALLLVVSFFLQVVAASTSLATPLNLPLWLRSCPMFVLVIFSLILSISCLAFDLLYKDTLRKTLEIAQKIENAEKTIPSRPPIKKLNGRNH